MTHSLKQRTHIDHQTQLDHQTVYLGPYHLHRHHSYSLPQLLFAINANIAARREVDRRKKAWIDITLKNGQEVELIAQATYYTSRETGDST